MNEVIRLENVVKLYPPRQRAVNGVSMSVMERESICICGAPGSGKSTLCVISAEDKAMRTYDLVQLAH